ncbi:TraR/DksA family transcriptional regulator [Spongiactinospora rosea]|uniref:TraR/DksA family transcriptional regulator n=1 Tax=Spongiactinospora rosea TaxID=2248750 RepID=A0A366M2E1_9ACTN|nr:TraR/DksA C4-type zinc finger protein [Spongiactinospora rosea]RBQ20356.1 TraR/DksA family transcriptional regulator [Spongiactinospora rosea]
MSATARAGKSTAVNGEGAWTEVELAEVRDNLSREMEELRVVITRSESEIASGDITEGAGDDQADAGAKTYEREREIALTLNSRDLLAQNERAIARIDAGTYGECESCHKPIGKERLRAFPRATLCVACKQKEERR